MTENSSIEAELAALLAKAAATGDDAMQVRMLDQIALHNELQKKKQTALDNNNHKIAFGIHKWDFETAKLADKPLADAIAFAREAKMAAHEHGDHKAAHQYHVWETNKLPKQWIDGEYTKVIDTVAFETFLTDNIQKAINAGDYKDAETYIEYGDEHMAYSYEDEKSVEKVQSFYRQMIQGSLDKCNYNEFNYFNNRLVENSRSDSREHYYHIAFQDKFSQKMLEMGHYETAYDAARSLRTDLIQDAVDDNTDYEDAPENAWGDLMKSSEKITDTCYETAIEKGDYRLATKCLTDMEYKSDEYLPVAEKMLDLATAENDAAFMFKLSGLTMYFKEWDDKYLYRDFEVEAHVASLQSPAGPN